MLFRHIGLADAATLLERALEETIKTGFMLQSGAKCKEDPCFPLSVRHASKGKDIGHDRGHQESYPDLEQRMRPSEGIFDSLPSKK
jgi:hypothetical protein